MSALICGSLAYDTIMVFHDQFKNHILPDKVHILNVSFLVPECLLIEPTETETREELDGFVDAMVKIQQEAENSPDLLKEAPHTQPVRRLDEVRAAKQLDLTWKPAAADA